MTLSKDLKRCFDTCEEAFAYLMRRRFLYTPNGWEHEFWTAEFDYDGKQFTVTTALREFQAAA